MSTSGTTNLKYLTDILVNFIESAVANVQQWAHRLTVILESLSFFHKRMSFHLHWEVIH